MRRAVAAVVLLAGLLVPVTARMQAQPASVPELLRQAQRAQAAGDWSEAARVWTQIVELNPVQPNYWFALGTARQRAKDYGNAVPAHLTRGAREVVRRHVVSDANDVISEVHDVIGSVNDVIGNVNARRCHAER